MKMGKTDQLVDLLEGCETLQMVFEKLEGWEVEDSRLHPSGTAVRNKVLSGHGDYAILERTVFNTHGRPKRQVVHPYGKDFVYTFRKNSY